MGATASPTLVDRHGLDGHELADAKAGQLAAMAWLLDPPKGSRGSDLTKSSSHRFLDIGQDQRLCQPRHPTAEPREETVPTAFGRGPTDVRAAVHLDDEMRRSEPRFGEHTQGAASRRRAFAADFPQ